MRPLRFMRFIGACALLVAAFVFRLWFGLSVGLSQADSKQTYLIGLKCYLTRTWPYFGADVLPQVQVPGALQGLAIALPLFFFPVPEAPFVLLNLLSLAGLCLLAWYCTRRLPDFPKWVIWAWLMTAPWALGESTHVYNPSYLLFGSALFFVGALETYPALRGGLIPSAWANFMMGAGVGWVMQFHMSYVLLAPYVVASFYVQWMEARQSAARMLASFAAGALATGIFVLPTVARFGWQMGSGSVFSMMSLHPYYLTGHLESPFGIVSRFLSFASFEVAPFIGPNLAARMAFVRQYLWVGPVVLLLTTAGILQPIALVLISLFARQRKTPNWSAVRGICFATIALLYVAFALSPKQPHAHNFYVVFPIAMIFSLHCWNELLQKKRWQVCAGILLASGVMFHIALSVYRQERHPWSVERRTVIRALERGDYREFGERRAGSLY